MDSGDDDLTPEELEGEIQDAEHEVETPQSLITSKREAVAESIDLQMRRQFVALRGHWSWWLIGWITALLLFQFGITIGVGLKCLDFSQYQWFLPIVTLQNFAQIVGMGFIIVNFLYPKRRS